MLDAHQLNVFLTAAKTLNFTVAARHLHMTQPSVSQHVHALEQHFGTPLFIRAGRHLRLTDSGTELMAMAQDMVSMSQRIDERMESLKGEVHGHLLVGCSTTVGKYVLPFLLASFMREHPKVSASCLVTPRKIAVQNLCDGEIHLALASVHEFCSDVEFHAFINDSVALIAPLNHAWALTGEIDVDELLQANFIVREEASGTRATTAEALAQVGISFDQLRTVLTLGNSEAIALAVQEGIGVGFISDVVVARLVQGKVARVKVRGLEIRQDIYIGRSTSRPATTAQKTFWEYLTDPGNPVVNDLRAISESGNSFRLSDTESAEPEIITAF
jgi:DNA-binding transcriptional LysR family regulator